MLNSGIPHSDFSISFGPEMIMSAGDNKDLMQRIMAWNTVNAMSQQMALGNAAIQAQYPNCQLNQVPFGSTVNVTNNGVSNLGKLAIAALAALGIGAGTMGLLNTGKATQPSAATTAGASSGVPLPTETSGSPSSPLPAGPAISQAITIEGTLTWEITPDGGLNTSIQSGTVR